MNKAVAITMILSLTSCATYTKEHPELKNPNVRVIHVPEKIEGNKFTESHRIFIIDEENTWKRK
jgi:hypothetical protein